MLPLFSLTLLDIACGVSFIALLLGLSQHITVTLFASLISFLAATLTLISFAIDIALYAYFKNQMGDLGFGGKTITGPGVLLSFTTFSCPDMLRARVLAYIYCDDPSCLGWFHCVLWSQT